MRGFTAGPWFASPVQTADDGWEFCTVGPFDVSGKPLEHHVEDTIAEVSGINHPCGPNARLIAAAPDLLAALHLAAEALDAYSDVNDGPDGPTPNRALSALQEISDVIAKAEGKPR